MSITPFFQVIFSRLIVVDCTAVKIPHLRAMPFRDTPAGEYPACPYFFMFLFSLVRISKDSHLHTNTTTVPSEAEPH